MSEFDIDKLFKSKLSDTSRKPSEEAWKNLEAGLGNKGKAYWMYASVAASVVLIIATIILFVQNGRMDNTLVSVNPAPDTGDMEQVDEKGAATSTGNESEIKSEWKEQEKPAEAKETVAIATSRKAVFRKGKSASGDPALATDPQAESMEMAAENEVQLADPIDEIENQNLNEELPLVAGELMAELSAPIAPKVEEYPEITIIYKSSEKPEEDKDVLRKVVLLARDIREADIGLGTLREAKNELLAFGFNKKTKNN